MLTENEEIVLVTGGSGFIGQHIIHLLSCDMFKLGIKEIRSVDLEPYKNTTNPERECTVAVRSFIGDIRKPETLLDAFRGVDTVFHCAGLISLQYPPNYAELDGHNVDGTRAVVELCVQQNVKRLIYTSCASVCMVPFKGHSTFAMVINQTESKATTPKYDAQNPNNFDGRFLITGYSSSKLRAETIVLNSNGALLYNQKGYLTTTAIRPPLTYGEGDQHFLPKILTYLRQRDFMYPRIAGAGGKQQIAYAGNVAWGHICAYKTLKTSAKNIAGLPVFITDDTPINDISRFIQKIGLASGKYTAQRTAWYLPHFLFFLMATLIELFIKFLTPVKKMKLEYSLRAISSFTASVMMFNRLRAAIHMDYVPLVEADVAIERTAKWVSKWFEENHSIETKETLKKHC
ncbi:3 beta-hydroxysteroid dehydrogenase/Delta 5--_4-isomerase type 4 [Glossina fuscipes fuscipes]